MRIGNEIFQRPLWVDYKINKGNATDYEATLAVLRASPLAQLLPWEASRDLTYGYKRRSFERVGQLREINTDYAPKFSGAETQKAIQLSILGDALEVDRILEGINPHRLAAEIAAMAVGVDRRLCDLIINGDRSAASLEFDGLSKIAEDIGGKQNREGLKLIVDNTINNVEFRRNITKVTAAVRSMRQLGLQPAIIANGDAIAALEIAGNVLGYGDKTTDAFGTVQINTLDGAAVIDAGMTNVHVAPTQDDLGRDIYNVEQREIIPTVEDGGKMVTDIYVIGMGTNGVKGLYLESQQGRAPVRFQTARTDAGAIRRYEIEAALGLAVIDERAVVKFSDVEVA